MKKIKQEKLTITDYFHYWRSLHKKYHSLDRVIDKKGLTVVGHEGCPLWYNRFFDYFTNLYFQKMLALAGNIKGKSILDIGCGGGRWSERLADRGAMVTGIDLGKEVIERNNEILGDKCKFMVMSADNLSFPDETFDMAVTVTVLQHMPYSVQEKAINEISRVVKTKGKVLIIERVGHKALPYTFPNSAKDWIEKFQKNGFVLLAAETNYFSPLIDLGHVLKNLLLPKRRFNVEPEKESNETKVKLSNKIYWNLMHPLIWLSYPLGYLCVYLIPQKLVKAKHSSFLFEKRGMQ
jgi:2-polyprenyl-3-methyl-5-hydroxy-6-metoxy-1,4-benzoquinol methylase